MSHEIYINLRGKASMAYVEDEPWHGLGQKLTQGASIETWTKEAGMDYTIFDTPVLFNGSDSKKHVHPTQKVLYRNDTMDPLGIVGNKYQVVQPGEVLEFFRDLVATGGYELHTAGVLFNGAKYWALARTGHTGRIGGKSSKDNMEGYLLLATSCDGTLQTTAQFTSIRVVCNNTLTASLLNPKDKIGAIKVSHRSTFDSKEVKTKLGLDDGWKAFVEQANVLSKIKVNEAKAQEFVLKLMGDAEKEAEKELASKPITTVLQLFGGKARGADMQSSDGTAWGLVNAVTEYVDHMAGVNQDQRLRMGWFYDGNILKRKAFDSALQLA